MTYNPRAEFLARQAKAAEAETQVSQEDGHVDAGNIEAESAKGEVDATADASKHTGETVEVASSEGALADTEKAAKAAEDHADVVAGTAPDAQTKEVDASKDGADCGEVTEMASTEELNKLPEQTEGSDNVAETEANPSEISTQEPEIATKAEDAPESPVEPYNSSESPEALAKGVVSEIKKVETGVTQVLNEDRAVGELENIATEMRAIIAEKGAMTSAEAMVATIAIQNSEKVLGGGTDIASLEGFADQQTAAIATEVSLEALEEKIEEGKEQVAESVSQGIDDIVGYANTIVPVLERYKKRASAVRGNVNNSNREAGLKELNDSEIESQLAVDGKTPNADTVLKTLKYEGELVAEVFSTTLLDAVQKAVTGEGGETPSLFGVISSAKVNHPVDEEGVTAKRTQPLFGNEHIVVTEAKKDSGVTSCIYVETSVDATTNAPLQTLTSAQQAEVLDGVISIADALIAYYGDLAGRGEDFSGAATGESGQAVRDFYQGVFVEQGKIARNVTVSLQALISYADLSLKASQADDEDPAEADANRAEAEEAK